MKEYVILSKKQARVSPLKEQVGDQITKYAMDKAEAI